MSERMREIIDKLNKANVAYYDNDAPIMSDDEWDALYEELKQLESAEGYISPDSPTQRVGGSAIAAFEQHTHLARLWSLDKVRSYEDVQAFCSRLRQANGGTLPKLSVEHKFDGLTINLTYNNGRLVTAATRGNGIVGEVILPQVMTIDSIPLEIGFKGLMEVQGEGIMRISQFERYNRTAAEPLKNVRNAAAGALRNLDPKVTRSRHLSAFFYNIGYIEWPDGVQEFSDLQGMLKFLERNGFSIGNVHIDAESETQVIDAIKTIEQIRETEDFATDGAVIKVCDFELRNELGFTDKFPRWAIAFKYHAEETITRLLDVTWQIGRTGKLTPLALLEPVEVGGATVSRATLNNWGDIIRKKIVIGADVFIRRSNDVIPEITGVVDEDADGVRPVVKLERCPVCGAELIETGANLFCPNRDGCVPQIVARLSHFAGRNAMDIEGLSDSTAEVLYRNLGVSEPYQLYTLTLEQLAALPRFAEKKAQNLFTAIQNSSTPELDAFIFALGIPNIGRKTARDLAQLTGSIDKLFTLTYDQLIAVEDIGDIVARSVLGFIGSAEAGQNDDIVVSDANRELTLKLLEYVTPKSVQIADKGGAFDGMTVVLTGTLSSMKRDEAKKLIEAMGGKNTDSVSQKTSLVIYGEKAGSKLDKARQFGIKLMDEAEFAALLQSEGKLTH